MRLAVFVSPHGFGHAARTAALLEALRAELPSLEVTLFTTVPRWFFAESLDFPFAWRPLACDVGFVQSNAVEEDLPATLERLERFWSEATARGVRELVGELRAGGFAAVLADVSPLALLAAKAAGLPSVLLESFTWEWLYAGVVDRDPRFAAWLEPLARATALATLRIQAEPVCEPVAGSVRVPPIARRSRSTAEAVRARIGVEPGRALVLVSLGGVEGTLVDPELLELPGVDFVVPGGVAAGEAERRRPGLVRLPHHTPIHHPDLVGAADAVVGKLGYSTVAEAAAAGSRYAYLPRPGFREHAVLARWVAARLPSAPLELAAFRSGAWLAELPGLLARPRAEPAPSAGAAAAARAIVEARILQA